MLGPVPVRDPSISQASLPAVSIFRELKVATPLEARAVTVFDPALKSAAAQGEGHHRIVRADQVAENVGNLDCHRRTERLTGGGIGRFTEEEPAGSVGNDVKGVALGPYLSRTVRGRKGISALRINYQGAESSHAAGGLGRYRVLTRLKIPFRVSVTNKLSVLTRLP